jgi:hypothetical protein
MQIGTKIKTIPYGISDFASAPWGWLASRTLRESLLFAEEI